MQLKPDTMENCCSPELRKLLEYDKENILELSRRPYSNKKKIVHSGLQTGSIYHLSLKTIGKQ
jgi:hypothetical protein